MQRDLGNTCLIVLMAIPACSTLLGMQVCGAWNFGPSLLEGNLTVAEVISIAQDVVPHPTQVQTVPDSLFSEESFLALNADKANSTLKWTCRLGPKESVEWAVVEAQGDHRVDIREVIHSQVQNFSDRRSVS